MEVVEMLRLHYKVEPLRLPGLGANSYCQTLELRSRQRLWKGLTDLLRGALRKPRARAAERAGMVINHPSGEFSA
jgi:hypothetical protein